MNNLTVEALRKSNHQVIVQHDRNYFETEGKKYALPCGGKTVVTVITPEGKQMKQQTFCHPSDNYNKKIGVRICLGRMFKGK